VWALTKSGKPVSVSLMTGMTNGIVTEVTGGQLTAGQQLIVGEALKEDEYSFLGLKFGF
jgi:hypothetical protein